MNPIDENLQVMAFIEAAPFAFGRHLAKLRRVKGWSQEKLALESGMARSYLGGIERGQRNVSLKNLVKLAKSLNIPTPVLMNFSVDEKLIQAKMQSLMLAGATVPPLSEKHSNEVCAPRDRRRRPESMDAQNRSMRSALHEEDSAYDADKS